MSPRGRWTVNLVRSDGLESHTLRPGRGRVMLGLAVAAIVLLIAGAGLGFYWASRVESATVNSLRATVASLEEDRDRVGVLAERLLEVEERYARLQAAVTEGRPESGPLPPVPFAPATMAPGL
ncbi:MAG: hypothetical protein R3266_05195, partial [Gemmatimonadota bacterium]|nr:hypothetical protein [Gemmatimonadota bacterium]